MFFAEPKKITLCIKVDGISGREIVGERFCDILLTIFTSTDDSPHSFARSGIHLECVICYPKWVDSLRLVCAFCCHPYSLGCSSFEMNDGLFPYHFEMNNFRGAKIIMWYYAVVRAYAQNNHVIACRYSRHQQKCYMLRNVKPLARLFEIA